MSVSLHDSIKEKGNFATNSALLIRYFLDALLGSMMFIMCAVMAWQVFSRYVLGNASFWSAEVARMMMVWMTMIGSAALIQTGGHVTVTVALDRMSERLKQITLIIRDIIMLVTLGVITYYGYRFAEMNEIQLSAAMEIPMSWIYSSLWLGSGLMVIMLILVRLGWRNPDWSDNAEGFE